ncbi:CocE/NonD family hydrolase [Hydrogenophaga laconesensis]|uniref:Acyl esterase n=1 Tax=Hydrogenophaga laconesensis TaxID=1805971 RepID=A0ABU1V7C2_9BURK|nr:CocE/NonD family hydrolase [Hydrogenophaga laconesensis]MDR7093218.1 putative acyl esterase [Hydrogenophaga laconesensis]
MSADSQGDIHTRTEVRDGMRITWNAPIRMPDGVVLRADVYRPVDESQRSPVIISHGVYAKGLSYQEGYPMQWEKMVRDYPEILQGSSNKYQAWEVTDPERWVPHGYAVVRVDSRGAGWSEGVLDPMSPQETEDFCSSIEWAAEQPWSNGSVGVLGISYYANMAWRVAERRPRGLKAVIPWEGFIDLYRDPTYHGGILNEFSRKWAAIQAVTVQYGLGSRARRNPNTGESIAGPVDMSDNELARRRRDLYAQSLDEPLDGPFWRRRTPDPSRIDMPFLSCANWGGMGIHPRGNFSGFTESPSGHKWLEVHGDSHWSLFSSNYGIDLQRRFLDHFLKGVDNSWDATPRVQLNIRHADGRFERRDEHEWPLARTEWTRLYLDAGQSTMTPDAPAVPSKASYAATGRGLSFRLPPVSRDTEITGPIAARLYIESSTSDADFFLVVQVFDPDGKELTFQGALDPNTPIAMGWLRASHRRVDASRSKPWQPYHPHDEVQPLTAGQVYELDIEILPTSIVLPTGWSLGLAVRGRDYEYEGEVDSFGTQFYYATRGTGGMTHNDPRNRPPGLFDNLVTLHTGGDKASYLLVPIVPPKA